MSAGLQRLLTRWIDASTKLSRKDYSCDINTSAPAADELQRQQTLHLELSDDHGACNELYNSISELDSRWCTQLINNLWVQRNAKKPATPTTASPPTAS
ncbi:hypothetical protein AAVH_10828 [Aphelenchoides avenae]|nr:hypothetical protein AAVH_10828 [Aphelenchus avenae]